MITYSPICLRFVRTCIGRMPSKINFVWKSKIESFGMFINTIDIINIIWYVYKCIDKLAGFGTLGLSTAP